MQKGYGLKVSVLLLAFLVLLPSSVLAASEPYDWIIGSVKNRAYASTKDSIVIDIETYNYHCNAPDATGQPAIVLGSWSNCPDGGSSGWMFHNVPGGEIYLTSELSGVYFDKPDGHYFTGADGKAKAYVKSTQGGWPVIKAFRGPNRTNYWADIAGNAYFEDCKGFYAPDVPPECIEPVSATRSPTSTTTLNRSATNNPPSVSGSGNNNISGSSNPTPQASTENTQPSPKVLASETDGSPLTAGNKTNDPQMHSSKNTNRQKIIVGGVGASVVLPALFFLAKRKFSF